MTALRRTTDRRRRTGVSRSAAAVLTMALALGACGDDVDEGFNEGRAPRGTVDGIDLQPATLPDISIPPPDTFPEDPFDPEPDETLPEPDDSPFGWVEYEPGLDRGVLEVPADYASPSDGTIVLEVARLRAADPSGRIGTLFVNPGGPGLLGASFILQVDELFGQDVLDAFDIIAWDVRGTGFQDHYLSCLDEPTDELAVDVSPDDDPERQALRQLADDFVTGCDDSAFAADLVNSGTAASARDIDAIRDALGEDTISYYGQGYGSLLGTTWAATFPDTVDALVLDGAPDPTVSGTQRLIATATATEAALGRFLAACSDDASCPLHNDGDAEAAFDSLGDLDDDDGRMYRAVRFALSNESLWPKLELALGDLYERSSSSRLQELFVESIEGDVFGQESLRDVDTSEMTLAISCIDGAGAATVDEAFALEPALQQAAPRAGRWFVGDAVICAAWNQRSTETITIPSVGSVPAVVIATTGDADVPVDSSRATAQALGAPLIIVEANQTIGYGVNPCVTDAVDAFLIDPSNTPQDQLQCA